MATKIQIQELVQKAQSLGAPVKIGQVDWENHGEGPDIRELVHEDHFVLPDGSAKIVDSRLRSPDPSWEGAETMRYREEEEFQPGDWEVSPFEGNGEGLWIESAEFPLFLYRDDLFEGRVLSHELVGRVRDLEEARSLAMALVADEEEVGVEHLSFTDLTDRVPAFSVSRYPCPESCGPRGRFRGEPRMSYFCLLNA